MKFTVAKQDLERALKSVGGALSSSGADLTAHYMFRLPPGGDGTKMEVLTYVGRLHARASFIADVTDTDAAKAFTVEGSRLNKWLTGTPDAALTFSFNPDKKVVSASAPRVSPQTFASLDPSNYPGWDTTYAQATEVAVLPALRLRAALDFIRRFTNDSETRSPEHVVCETRNGIVQATNGNSSAGLVTVKGLEKSCLRVHRNDAPGCMGFLGNSEDEVTLLEMLPRAAFFRDAGGAIFGVTRFDVKVPQAEPPPAASQRFWSLAADEVKAALSRLRSGAADEDNRLYFNRPNPDGPVVLSMMSTTGTMTSAEVTVVDSTTADGVPALPDKGFMLSVGDFEKALGAMTCEPHVRFGINVLPRGGYVRFEEVRFADSDGNNGDLYVCYLMWLR